MQCKNKLRLWEKGSRRRDSINFILVHHKGLRPVFLYTTCKESSTNSINFSHTINQPISTPCRNQEPCWIDQLLLHLPINFSRNTKLTQFLLPVEIKNPAKLINCSPQLPINFSRNTRLTPIAQTNKLFNDYHRITMNTT